MYNLIKNMYNNLSIRVKTSKGLSHLIKSNNGVRQGDGISPLLFNIFINDLPSMFMTQDCESPTLNVDTVPCLLYADDLIILSQTAQGLQTGLKKLQDYCNTWKLNLNILKTKIIIVQKGGKTHKTNFYFNENCIEIVQSYRYLGTIISSNGTFTLAREELKNKGLKALFSMWRSISPGKIPPLTLATKLFDSLVKPILIYNSDVWCSEIPATMQRHIVKGKLREHEDKYINESPFEKVHVKFCKMILGVKKHTSNIACRAEMGRFPLHLEMYVSMIKYWLRLNKTPRDRLTADALNDNLFMQESGVYMD